MSKRTMYTITAFLIIAVAMLAPIGMLTHAQEKALKLPDNVKAEIPLDKAKDLLLISKDNALARSDYNLQVERFNQVPEIKTILDRMTKTAADYRTVVTELLKAAGLPDADVQKYGVDLDEGHAGTQQWLPHIVPVQVAPPGQPAVQ